MLGMNIAGWVHPQPVLKYTLKRIIITNALRVLWVATTNVHSRRIAAPVHRRPTMWQAAEILDEPFQRRGAVGGADATELAGGPGHDNYLLVLSK